MRATVQAIHRHLFERRGIDLSRYKESYLKRRLLVRVRALRLAGLEEYAVYLRRHPEEIGPLQRALSIQVTGFFRNRSCFDFLKENVVPDLVQRSASRQNRLAVWSAGCATGEETWSLAALFATTLGARSRTRLRITGTDLDEEALQTARRAVYPADRLAATMPGTERRHFEERADGRAAPRESLRRLVRFERESLLDPFDRDDLDLIVCRNVLIYFSLEHQADILGRFAAALSAGGFLVLGRVERLLGEARLWFDVASARERVYRRLGGAAPSNGHPSGGDPAAGLLPPHGVACA
ncbi:MAG TPA: protein-glutamate O-methyltransferase CheR [Candidatus Polarisedimenticolia bacterium]|nr:protein-glutamate O-methyltransferase CheR [Candidatus Polarisedimenticolia bacterium]